MKKYGVREGNTGVLELIDEKGSKEVYHPDYDIDKAQALLYEFYEIETASGIKVKNAFQKNGTDWFPTAVSSLCWQFFYQYVKYRPLAEAYLKGDAQFVFESPGRFEGFITSINLNGKSAGCLKKISRIIYHAAMQIRNRLVTRNKGDILFFRYGISDFRTGELMGLLREKYQVTQVTGVAARKIFKHILDPQLYIATTGSPSSLFNHTLPNKTTSIFRAALHYAQSLINSHWAEYQSHLKIMQRLSYRLFFGIDDTNFVYPLIYAAQDAGMKTLGFQHGVYSLRHEAYILQGIERYRWYDNVLVWGGYWREVVLKHSKLFSDDFHIIASNKHTYDYSRLPKKAVKPSILVPYEFLADSIAVGRYMKLFIEKGFRVYFKPRSDEPVQGQVDAYYLGEYEKDIVILKDTDPEAMAEIDVIAGTQTTLLFDLLPYNKPVWILDTPFRLMHDMVEDGFARLITEKDMEEIDMIYEEEMKRERKIDPAYFFGSKPVPEAVEEYLAGGAVIK